MTKEMLVALVAAIGCSYLPAACKEGTTTSCRLNGKLGKRECVSGRFTPCLVETPPEPSATLTVTPRYMVLNVIYAPPGTKGGSASSVVYGSESTTGTTVGSSSSFKTSHKVSVSASGGPIGGTVSATANYGYTRTTGSDSLLDIKKGITNEITVRGPGVDGIDHDRDEIWLWLSPKLRVTVTKTSAAWTVADGQNAEVVFVFTGHLKNPSQIPAGTLERLVAHKITPADYPAMLAANPFANGATRIDPARFQSLRTTFPYSPPFAPGDPVTTLKMVLTEAATQTNSTNVQREDTVGMAISAEGGVPLLAKASLKAESAWTWTQKNSQSSSTSTKETASVTVGGPSFGFAGPGSIAVFYDVLYKTFLFAPVTGPIQFTGTVKDRTGKALAGQEVIVTAGGLRHRTFTNARGEYAVPGQLTGTIDVSAGGARKRVTPGPGGRDLVTP